MIFLILDQNVQSSLYFCLRSEILEQDLVIYVMSHVSGICLLRALTLSRSITLVFLLRNYAGTVLRNISSLTWTVVFGMPLRIVNHGRTCYIYDMVSRNFRTKLLQMICIGRRDVKLCYDTKMS